MSSPPVWAVFSYHQPHIFKSLTMLCAGGNDIYTSGVDAAVTEDIGELGDVLLDAVECAGKQVSEVVWKHFAGVYVCITAKLFHLTPDVCSADGIACFCDKYDPCVDMVALCIFHFYCV